jgi:hypothetical protein
MNIYSLTEEDKDIFESLKYVILSPSDLEPIPSNQQYGGIYHPMYGKTHTEESKQLMSDSQKTTSKHSTRGKSRPQFALQMAGKNNPMYGTISPFRGKKHKIVQCPHCLKTGGEPQMIQWHFDKCKLKS